MTTEKHTGGFLARYLPENLFAQAKQSAVRFFTGFSRPTKNERGFYDRRYFLTEAADFASAFFSERASKSLIAGIFADYLKQSCSEVAKAPPWLDQPTDFRGLALLHFVRPPS
jgi:hypothetical protein